MTLIEQFEKESGMKYPKHDMSAQANFDDMYEEWLEKRVPQWIDVNDRLPEKDCKYLIYSRWGIQVDFYNASPKRWNQYKPTHWMELPEPPKDIL